MKISGHEEYFEALAKIEDGRLNADDGEALEGAVRTYLLDLSPMKREQIAVHAPTQELRGEHEYRLNQIKYGRHNLYLRRLSSRAGVRLIAQTDDELKTNAAVGAAMWQRGIENAKLRVKEKGRLVQCQECAGFFSSSETERIKPYGSTTYRRYCAKCAESIKMAKKIFTTRR